VTIKSRLSEVSKLMNGRDMTIFDFAIDGTR
jgi:hypothetical protein